MVKLNFYCFTDFQYYNLYFKGNVKSCKRFFSSLVSFTLKKYLFNLKSILLLQVLSQQALLSTHDLFYKVWVIVYQGDKVYISNETKYKSYLSVSLIYFILLQRLCHKNFIKNFFFQKPPNESFMTLNWQQKGKKV